MYTDEDLENAVEEGIFSQHAIQTFRTFIASRNATQAVDEENFKLIASFNDIFVVIACALLLFSAAWVSYDIHAAVSNLTIAILSWLLAEFFVRKRKMALPGIVLLMTFVGGVFAFVESLSDSPSELSLMLSGAIASLAAWFHWRRFKVPVTVAAGTASAIVFILAILAYVFPGLKDHMQYPIFLSGLLTFIIAMAWDAADIRRVSGRSDVAFWLHLLSAPLIVHPVFSNLGILQGNESMLNIVVVVVLYVFLSGVSVIIDRRAFMVSSLAYVLYALTQLFNMYGFASDGFAYVGLIIGFSLLLLSGFWHKARSHLYAWLPSAIQERVPAVK